MNKENCSKCKYAVIDLKNKPNGFFSVKIECAHFRKFRLVLEHSSKEEITYEYLSLKKPPFWCPLKK